MRITDKRKGEFYYNGLVRFANDSGVAFRVMSYQVRSVSEVLNKDTMGQLDCSSDDRRDLSVLETGISSTHNEGPMARMKTLGILSVQCFSGSAYANRAMKLSRLPESMQYRFL